jgi:ascorbate-specific PTS system EIIC-type component UlaA
LNVDNWLNILENHWITALVNILLLIFVIDIIQSIISHYRSQLSNEQQEQLKEISRLMETTKFGKPSKL